MTNKEFVEAYFKFVHHPHENAGVDFWWIDWNRATTEEQAELTHYGCLIIFILKIWKKEAEEDLFFRGMADLEAIGIR